MPYDSSRRQEGARSTRARVIDAAQASFLAHGYGATTIRRVAEDAGVSQETIYKTFGGKAALVKAVYDRSLAGDDDDIPLSERPEAIAVRDASSPDEAATAYAELARVIASRIDPLLRVLHGAGDGDQALVDFARTTDQERHVGSSFYVTRWADNGWLREGITLEYAIDSIWALNAAPTRWLLMDHGWTAEEYTRWLAEMFRRAIFQP